MPSERKVKALLFRDSQDALLFREIEKRGLLVSCRNDGTMLVTDGQRDWKGQSLREVMKEIVK